MSLVAVLVLCAAGITALAMQIQCIDAAREAARLAARGDPLAASSAMVRAPAGASVELRSQGSFVVARVSGRSPLLPGLHIEGLAVAAAETGR